MILWSKLYNIELLYTFLGKMLIIDPYGIAINYVLIYIASKDIGPIYSTPWSCRYYKYNPSIFWELINDNYEGVFYLPVEWYLAITLLMKVYILL